MIEPYRIRNGLQEWNRPPDGYVPLPIYEPVQAGDVQKIHDEWFIEYPANGFLVGKTRGAGGLWLRKAGLPILTQSAEGAA